MERSGSGGSDGGGAGAAAPVRGRLFGPGRPGGLGCDVSADGSGLRIAAASGRSERIGWPEAELALGGSDSAMLVVSRGDGEGRLSLYLGRPLARPLLERAAPAATLRRLEALERSEAGERRRRRVLGASALAIVGLLGWGLLAGADALAIWGVSRVPAGWEVPLGAALVGSLAPPGERLEAPEVREVVDAILARLEAAAPPRVYAFEVHVVDDPTVNALALPGGQIVVYAGLIDEAASPEELAGVMGHEMAHVLERHGLRSIARELKWRLLLALLVGDLDSLEGVILANATRLASLDHSREAELEADRRGFELLTAARIDPRGLAAFFERLGAREADLPGVGRYLSSHPASGERAAIVKRLGGAGQGLDPAPLLEDERVWLEAKKMVAREEQR